MNNLFCDGQIVPRSRLKTTAVVFFKFLDLHFTPLADRLLSHTLNTHTFIQSARSCVFSDVQSTADTSLTLPNHIITRTAEEADEKCWQLNPNP